MKCYAEAVVEVAGSVEDAKSAADKRLEQLFVGFRSLLGIS
jgi:hypothetical protein